MGWPGALQAKLPKAPFGSDEMDSPYQLHPSMDVHEEVFGSGEV